jgi:hypothetical protein
MKLFVLTLAAFVAVVILLGVWALNKETRSAPDCPQKVYIVKRPDGESLECVCGEGSLATCFKPGP